MGARLRFDNLTLGYERHPAVHHLSGTVAAGTALAVVGPNGAGKSTLLKGIAGLLRPLGGRVMLEGCRPRDIAYLPQQPALDRGFPVDVADFVAMGCWRRSGAFGAVVGAGATAVAEAIAAVGLAGFEDRAIGTLSGGQMQRALFARVIVQDAPLILLDEAFSAIDRQTVADLAAIVARWRADGRTVIAVLHDFAQVRAHFAETLVLARAPVAWGPTDKALRESEALFRAHALHEAWDRGAGVCEQDAA